MLDPRDSELRQIKQLLVAILVCVAIIALALAPVLIPIAFVLGVGIVLVMFGISMTQTARFTLRQLWYALSARWRRQRLPHGVRL